MLTRDQILAFRAVIPTETVDVPEWGGQVKVRGLTAGERDSFEVSLKGKKSDIRAGLVARCLVDEAGNRLFTDEDITTLSGFHASPVDRVFTVASRLSAITPADRKALEGN